MNKITNKIFRFGSPNHHLLLIASLIISLLACAIGASIVSAQESTPTPDEPEFKITRSLPSSVVLGRSFDVTVTFTAPADGFNSIGLSDTVPDGWTVILNTAKCVPEADLSKVEGGATAQYVWYGDVPFDAGTEFTAIYTVTVPSAASVGTYNVTGGKLVYYIGTEKYEADIADSSITVRTQSGGGGGGGGRSTTLPPGLTVTPTPAQAEPSPVLTENTPPPSTPVTTPTVSPSPTGKVAEIDTTPTPPASSPAQAPQPDRPINWALIISLIVVVIIAAITLSVVMRKRAAKQ